MALNEAAEWDLGLMVLTSTKNDCLAVVASDIRRFSFFYVVFLDENVDACSNLMELKHTQFGTEMPDLIKRC